jgi:hypothetical protein
MKSTYELVNFRSSKDPEFLKALKLYSENIEPSYRTDSKEIMYWIENYRKKFKDSFYALGFYYNDIMIGFSELAYFVDEKFIIVDYIVIDKNFRRNNTFFEFIHQIKEFLSKENLVFNYIVCEVGCYFENVEPPEASKLIIRLLKQNGFGVVKCRYYAPRLGLTNYESEVIAILMIYGNETIKQIKKETLLLIINSIYYKYYFRWYKVFMNEKEIITYKSMLDSLMLKIEKGLNHKEIIDINGLNNLFPVIPGDFKPNNFKKSVKLLSFLLISIFCIAGVGSATLFVQKYYGINVESQVSIFSFSLVFILLISSLIFEKRMNFFSNLLEKIIDKL